MNRDPFEGKPFPMAPDPERVELSWRELLDTTWREIAAPQWGTAIALGLIVELALVKA